MKIENNKCKLVVYQYDYTDLPDGSLFQIINCKKNPSENGKYYIAAGGSNLGRNFIDVTKNFFVRTNKPYPGLDNGDLILVYKDFNIQI